MERKPHRKMLRELPPEQYRSLVIRSVVVGAVLGLALAVLANAFGEGAGVSYRDVTLQDAARTR